jgi:streptogramin lyase
MKHPDNVPQSDLPDPARRNRMIAVVGTTLAILLVVELALQFALHTGWRTYRGFDTVSAIAVDGHGQAWAVGNRQGRESLMTYTENGSRVEVTLPDALTQAHPIALMLDRQDRVWVGTDFGMIGMRNVDGIWILFSPEEYGSDSTRQIIMDGQGRVWARSHRGPAELDPGSSERTIRYANSGIANNDAVSMAVDPEGHLWVLTMQRELKVHEADGTWRTVVVVPGTVRYGFMDAALAFDPQGQIWLATVQGVGVLSPDGAWKEYPLGDPYRPLSMRGVLPDSEGRVWISALQQGVFLFDPQAGWTNYTSRNSGIVRDANAMALDPQGRVWIASSYGRLTGFDPNAALPAGSIPAVHRTAMAIVPFILLNITLLAMLLTTSVRRSVANRKEIAKFSLGFAGWFVVALLFWFFLRYSNPPTDAFMFFNPLALLAPLVNLLLLIILFARQRRMFSGAISALLVNWSALLLFASGAEESLSLSTVGTLFMLPFFMAL